MSDSSFEDSAFEDGGDSVLLGGRLLVAAPALADPNFARSVILVLNHDDDGALGLVLNRPMDVAVSEMLASWEDQAKLTPPGVVFKGGPVAPNAVIGLARSSEWQLLQARRLGGGTRGAGGDRGVAGGAGGDRGVAGGAVDDGGVVDSGGSRGWSSALPGLSTVDLSLSPEDQPGTLAGTRLYSGYAGWSTGQLEEEISEGAWFVFDASMADVFVSDPAALWHDVLQRQGGWIALLASYPFNPSTN